MNRDASLIARVQAEPGMFEPNRPGRMPCLGFQFSPMTRRQLCELVASRVSVWTLDDDGEPAPVDAASVACLPDAVLREMVRAVTGVGNEADSSVLLEYASAKFYRQERRRRKREKRDE